ncbi:MAG: TetR/AcrR family transcriptional regulator [Actinobacteria bacterium]|nr:TetR/AcrR family transcriptional regulator [Actinomycetota bacterium]
MVERITRANGEASRRRILDAAAEIAGERGYAGTSISDVSSRSGLPKSSIYWHFSDKDALFAAVIEDSYERWLEEFNIRVSARDLTPQELVVLLHDSLADFPAFLRFGHLVILEWHDTELSARAKFLDIRRRSLQNMSAMFERTTGVDAPAAASLAAVALALVDGAFLARAAGENTLADSSALAAVLEAFVDRTRTI